MGLVQVISDVALRRLSEQRFATLRSQYMNAKERMAPVWKAIYGTFDSNDLRRHLEEQVGRDYEILMVHSSVNHMKPMYQDDPLTFVRMLIDFCGKDRTLVMPGFFFGDPKVGSVRETFTLNSRFDLRRTPSQVGLATELFRRSKGVLQSRHPVFRVSAFGPLAAELVKGHETAGTSCGIGTPFDFMARHESQIIGIGKPSIVLTQVHHAEDVLGDSFPVPRETGDGLQVTLVDGEIECEINLPKQGFQWRREMQNVPRLLGDNVLREWKFHNVPFFSTRAGEVSETLMAAAKNGKTLFKPTQ